MKDVVKHGVVPDFRQETALEFGDTGEQVVDDDAAGDVVDSCRDERNVEIVVEDADDGPRAATINQVADVDDR